MELKPEVQQLIKSRESGDGLSVAETTLLSSEIINLLTVAGIDVRTAVDLVHKYRDAHWFAGYDAGYRRGTHDGPVG